MDDASRVVAVLRGDSNVRGTVTFEQPSESAPTKITYDITGYDPNAKRGMHIHQFGDNTNGCTSAGPHCASTIMDLLSSIKLLANRLLLQKSTRSPRRMALQTTKSVM